MRFKFIALGLVISVQVVAEGIATDGTMGAAQILSGSSITIPQTLGSTVGNNLFHSFSDFNINTGQTVTFTGADNLQNVISRVTGNNKSVIDGTLKSEIKNADFYFINPNGITFNANASLDVPAAFHVTTADKIDFGKNGGVFYSDLSKKSQLSSDSPAALGFLGTSKVNNGLIDFNGAKITLNKSETLDVVAGNITLENKANLKTESGQARLIAMKGENNANLRKNNNGVLPLPETTPSTINAGQINMDSALVDATGNGGGRIAIWVGDVLIKDSNVYTDNTGEINATAAKNIDVHASLLNLDNSSLSFDALDKGNAGNVNVNSTTIQLTDGGYISSDIWSQGNAGKVTLMTNDLTIDGQESGITSNVVAGSAGNAGSIKVNGKNLQLLNGGYIGSSTWSQGNAGNVIVATDDLIVGGQGSGIVSTAEEGSMGNAGDIVVNGVVIQLLNGGVINSGTRSQGNAGVITIITDNLTIDRQNSKWATGIMSIANLGSMGNSGDIKVNAGKIELLNGGVISSDTRAKGDAGTITVTSNELTINSQNFSEWVTGILSNAKSGSSGKSGIINVEANVLNIVNGGEISSSIWGTGNAEMVKVISDNLTINGENFSEWATGISSTAENQSTGKAGSIIVSARTIHLLNGGIISGNTWSEGQAGEVEVTTDNLTIDKQSSQYFTGIASNAEIDSVGNAGSILVNGKTIILLDGGEISSSTLGKGDAGAIKVIANNLTINNKNSTQGATGIFSIATDTSSGQTGNINVVATNSIDLFNQSKISMENQANVTNPNSIRPSHIIVTTPNITMINYSQITTQSTGSNIAAGNINVNFSNRLNMDNSFINTSANTGDGGEVNVKGGELIYLKNSVFGTTVIGENSNGGDISVKAKMLVMDTGLIQANAVSGNGGNINLALQALIPSANQLIKGGKSVDWNKAPSNVIQAASESGDSGTINNFAPQMNLSGVLANIGNNNFDNRLVSQDYCAVNKGSSLSKKGKGALPLRAKDLQVY